MVTADSPWLLRYAEISDCGSAKTRFVASKIRTAANPKVVFMLPPRSPRVGSQIYDAGRCSTLIGAQIQFRWLGGRKNCRCCILATSKTILLGRAAGAARYRC